MELTKIQVSIIKVYLKTLLKKGMHPSRLDMAEAGHNRDSIRQHFVSLQNLRAQAKEYDPKSFESIIDETLFTPKAFNKLAKTVRSFRRFVITTAVVGCPVHKGFLKSIRTYCKRNDAMLLVLPSADPASGNAWSLDPKLGKDHIVFGDISLNSNFFISGIKLSAKAIDPSTGLDRIGQRHGSFIYASPKQRLKFMPVSNVKHPHAEMTPGAITLPRYNSQRFMSERTAYIANHDHVMGAMIVEIADNKRYHFRPIQADSEGNFVDLGDFYTGNSVSKMFAEAFSLGDWHSGETDPSAVRAWKEVIDLVKPKKLFIHDGFNGMSINPHEKEKQISRAILADKGTLDLKAEITHFAKDLDMLASLPGIEQIIVVKSNHDVFLERWLEQGDWTKDPANYKLSLRLAGAMADGHNPLQFGAEMLGLKAKSSIKWLSIDEDYFIARIQCGAHGHKGPKGSRGNIKGMERAYGQCVTGHSHGPEILRGAYQNGTSSYLKLAYNEGPSDWVHSSTLIYSNGMRQMINSFDGDWHLKSK